MKQLLISLLIATSFIGCTTKEALAPIEEVTAIEPPTVIVDEPQEEYEQDITHSCYNEPIVKEVDLVLTFYGPSEKENGKGNAYKNAVNGTLYYGTIAVPYDIPLRTKFLIPDFDPNTTFEALDRGNPKYIKMLDSGEIRIDVFVDKTDQEIRDLGVKKMKGYIIIEER